MLLLLALACSDPAPPAAPPGDAQTAPGPDAAAPGGAVPGAGPGGAVPGAGPGGAVPGAGPGGAVPATAAPLSGDPAPGTPAPGKGAPATPAPGKGAPATPAASTAIPAVTAATASAAATPAATPAATAAPAAPIRYRLDPGRSQLYVQVYKDPDTLAAGLSHDHVVVASGWTGTVVWSVDDPAACKIDLTIPVAQLQNDAPEWRTRVGYDTTLSEGQRGEVRDHMLGASQLDAARYPEIRFVSTGCAPGDAPGTWQISGDLTLHGQTRQVTVKMKIGVADGQLSASGALRFRQSSFGFSPFSAMAGALKNKDEVKLTINVKGAPAS